MVRFLPLLIGCLGLFLSGIVQPAVGQVRLKEIMAEGFDSLTDSEGDATGWLELANTGPNRINLVGYGLSANPDDPFHWTFPSVELDPGEALIVLLSGKDRRGISDAAARATEGAAFFLPSQLPGLLWWLDAADDATLELTDNRLTRWLDKSQRILETTNDPIRFDAVALEEIHRPLHILDPITQLPGIRFDGEKSLLQFPEISGIRTAFWVLNEPKSASDSFRPFLGHTNDLTYIRDYNRLIFAKNHATWIDGTSVNPRQTQLPRGRRSITAMTDEPGLANSLAKSLAYPDLRWAGDMMEIILYDRLLSEEERERVQEYLNRKWLLPAQELHTNFKLSRDEAVYLTEPDGTRADMAPPIVAAGPYSRGRVAGSEIWEWFADPTPGTRNTTSSYSRGAAPALTFQPTSSFFTNEIVVRIEPPGVTGGIIYYSLDGSEPDQLIYEKPLQFQVNTTLRARWIAPGYAPSPVATHHYIQPPPGQLAVLALTTPPENLWDESSGIYVAGNTNSEFYPNYMREWERPVNVAFFEPDGRQGFQLDCGLKIHGAYSRSFPQRSLRLHFRNRYGAGKLEYPIFPGNPVSRFESIILRNFGNDWNLAFMRDVVSQSLGAQLNLDHQDWRPAHVFLNGSYHGLYEIRERMDGEYLAQHHGGDAEDYDMVRNIAEVISGNGTRFDSLADAANELDPSDQAAFERVVERMDLDNFINYVALGIYTDNTDWPFNNVITWSRREPSGRLRWALNDMDSTFNGWGYGVETNSVELVFVLRPESTIHSTPTDFIRQLPKNPGFLPRFLNQFADVLNTTLSPSNVSHQIEKYHHILAPAIPAQIRRWGIESNGPTLLDSMEAWERNVDVLRDFAERRPQFVREHLANHFGSPGLATLRVSNPTPSALSRLQINSITLSSNTTEWNGVYFQGVPVQVVAIPAPGWRWMGWEGFDTTNTLLQITLTNSNTTTISPILVLDDSTRVPTLASGTFRFDQWDSASPEGTYPPGMIFQQTTNKDPSLETFLEGVWPHSYNRTSRSRIVGRGNQGISFINTSDPAPSGGYLGAALVQLNTQGQQHVRVSWIGRTIRPNDRPYALRLQWRPGNTNAFADVLDTDGAPIEYQRQLIENHFQRFGPISLPATADNQPLIQLRWKYYAMISNASGARAELGLDDIDIESTSIVASPPTLNFVHEGDTLRVRVFAEAQRRVWLDGSSDLVRWTPLEFRVQPAYGLMEFLPPVAENSFQFFRLRIE